MYLSRKLVYADRSRSEREDWWGRVARNFDSLIRSDAPPRGLEACLIRWPGRWSDETVRSAQTLASTQDRGQAWWQIYLDECDGKRVPRLLRKVSLRPPGRALKLVR